jgi:two-component system chemotaxis response regulator CheY
MARLLLVDDDPVLLGLMAKLLGRAGHTVVEAGSGAEGLARAAGEAFDLIISDVMMPDLDGYALTRQLRANPATRHIPVLLLTSRLQGPDEALSRSAGADGQGVKTVNVARLNQQIEDVLAARLNRRRQAPQP